MKSNETIRIAIAENSVIIRSGLASALKRLPNLKVQTIELVSVEALSDCLRSHCPDILIVNPAFGDYFDVARFREEIGTKRIRVVALVSSFIDASLLSKYDDSISIFDTLEVLGTKMNHLQDISPVEPNDNQEVISQREKEIVVCVVKGMTNKEIAEKGIKPQPAIMVLEYGKGRIFHTILGHNTKAIENPGFSALIINGIEWAATGKVTQKLKK